MAVTDPRVKKFAGGKIVRSTQVIFGEQKHLLEVLLSIQKARLPRARKQNEIRQLRKLIAARTEELNRITPSWDLEFNKAQNPKTTARELLRLADRLSPHDYLIARALTEHPESPAEVLARMAAHLYSAVRENVARHPHTPPEVLRKLAEDSREPLWFLVACNPSTPVDLKERLRARMRESAPQ
jgi:leucine rich repeat (LRR) protein